MFKTIYAISEKYANKFTRLAFILETIFNLRITNSIYLIPILIRIFTFTIIFNEYLHLYHFTIKLRIINFYCKIVDKSNFYFRF